MLQALRIKDSQLARARQLGESTGAGTTIEPLGAGGRLLLEHGFEQGEAGREVLSAQGLIDVETLRDLEARDRVTLGRAP